MGLKFDLLLVFFLHFFVWFPGLRIKDEKASRWELVSDFQEKSFESNIIEVKMDPLNSRQANHDIELFSPNEFGVNLLDVVFTSEVQLSI